MKRHLLTCLTTALSILLIAFVWKNANKPFGTVFAQEKANQTAGCEVTAVVEKYEADVCDTPSIEKEPDSVTEEELIENQNEEPTEELVEELVEEDIPIVIFLKPTIPTFPEQQSVIEETETTIPEPIQTSKNEINHEKEPKNDIKEKPPLEIVEIRDDATETPKFWTFIRNIIWSITKTNEDCFKIENSTIAYFIIGLFFILWILILLIILAIRHFIKKLRKETCNERKKSSQN